jgi:hypothetical protein
MPVEIRELQINVTVNQQNAATTAPTAAPGGAPSGNEEKKAIINQCIEQVLEIFNNRKER